MVNHFLITFTKTFFMNLCMIFSFIKIKGCKKDNKRNVLLLTATNFIVDMLYATIYENIDFHFYPIFINLSCYIFYLIISSIIIKEIDRKFFEVALLSICFSFSAFLISSVVLFIFIKLQILKNITDTVIEYSLAGSIQFLILYYFFKIKRFKDGFSFIKEDKVYKSVNIVSLILSATLIIFIFFGIKLNTFMDRCVFFSIMFGMVIIINLIRNKITQYYKVKMKDKTVETLNEQIQEKNRVIEDLRAELDATLKINHKYNHRISAVEKAISKLNISEEFANENGDLIDLVKELSKNYKDEVSLLEKQSALEKTGIFGIDNIIEYMNSDAEKNNISFFVEVNCDVNNINEKIIKQSKLETLLADHIKDAIIAINYSDSTHRQIKLSFNKIDSIYEIKISDTGINFEIETLLKLGQEQVTTHKESGGSGIGFMTTFETLKEYKGSLIIEEYNNNNEDYTKSIIIKFDNKNEYIVRSYRAEEIKQQDKYNRLIVENKL